MSFTGQLLLYALTFIPVLKMREKAISGMMAESHKRDSGTKQIIDHFEVATKQKDDRITQLQIVTKQKDEKITQLEMVTKQKNEKISQLEKDVSSLWQLSESYRKIAIPTNAKLGPLPVSDMTASVNG